MLKTDKQTDSPIENEDSVTKKTSTTIIYHMLPAAIWNAQSSDAPYEGDTLATEGFIHCTGEQELLIKVANNFYRDTPGPFVILYIEESAIEAEVRWEEAGMHTFPHIYGPLNLDAVVNAIPFPQRSDGVFEMPREW